MPRHFTRVITTPAAARMVREWNRPVVSLLTDFGSRDPSAGILHGIVLAIAPEALVLDVSHDVDKFQVPDGALLLWCAAPYLPIGAHVAVVDPGVGTDRRGIAVETARGDYLIGPDNGILIPGATRLGGIVRAHSLENPQYRLPVVTTSFHGRDLFAPAAAHLAMGVPLETLGPAIDPMGLTTLDWPEPAFDGDTLRTRVIYIDTFGNLKLAALADDLWDGFGPLEPGETLELRLADRPEAGSVTLPFAPTFGTVGVGWPLLIIDSYGRLAIAVNQGSAAQRLGLVAGQDILVRRHVGEPAPDRWDAGPTVRPAERHSTSEEPIADVPLADVPIRQVAVVSAPEVDVHPGDGGVPEPYREAIPDGEGYRFDERETALSQAVDDEPRLDRVEAAPSAETETLTVAPEPLVAREPEPEPVVVAPEFVVVPPVPEPEPEPEPEPVAVAPVPDPPPVPEPEPVAVVPEPEPEPVARMPEPDSERVAVAPEPEPQPQPEPVQEPEPEPASRPERSTWSIRTEDAVPPADEPESPQDAPPPPEARRVPDQPAPPVTTPQPEAPPPPPRPRLERRPLPAPPADDVESVLAAIEGRPRTNDDETRSDR